MSSVIALYDRIAGHLSGRVFEGLALLFTRIALGGIFWRSYNTKVVDGSWFEIDEFQYVLFANEFSGLPLPPQLAVPITTYAEFALPVLLVLGLFTRFAALGLFIMTMVIQIFVFPNWDIWWITHIGWVAMALVLISRGAGLFSIDQLTGMARAR